MPSNLQIPVANFVRKSGYFYHLSHTADTLYKKVDSGENAFSYPLNADITNEVKALHYDGRYFYTLENITTGNGELLIKKWEIEDYILKLKRTYDIVGTSTKKYNCNAMAIESYDRTLTSGVGYGTNILQLNDISRLVPGDVLNIGPSTYGPDIGKIEDVTLLTTSGSNYAVLTSNLTYSYNSGDAVSFAPKCWFFNKYATGSDPDPGSGGLFYFNLNPIGSPVTYMAKQGTEFRDILAAGFVRDSSYPAGAREFLVYIKQTNLLFIEVDPLNGDYLTAVQSAAQNNQDPNDSNNVIPVYDLAFEGNTIYRLQQKGVFRSGSTYSTENWSPNYSYQLSTLTRIPYSISVTPVPSIISADGVSTSNITAIVKNQFDTAVPSKTVNFTDNDTGTGSGYLTPTSRVTDSNGVASVTYTSGTSAKTVTIIAEV